MIGTIYALADPDTGDIRYCGKTVRSRRRRMTAHRYDAVIIQRRRHSTNWLRTIYATGKEPEFMVCELVELAGLDRRQQMVRLNEAERRWIAQLKALGFKLTNATNGGDGTHGRKASAETRARIGRAHKGKTITAEQRDTMRLAQLARDKGTFVRGPAHPNWQKPFSCDDEATRVAKIKEAWADPKKRAAHGQRYAGAKNVNAKLTPDQARAIFLAEGTLKAIGNVYGVCLQTVWQIKQRNTWQHATASLEGTQ